MDSPRSHRAANDELLITQGGTKCPACRASANLAIRFADFDLYCCPGCGCWSSDALARGAAASFEPQQYFANPRADESRWQRFLDARKAADLEFKSVLDVGCGSGAYLQWLAERHPRTRQVGIEIETARAELAQAANPHADIIIGDAGSVVTQLDNSFDLITLWDVFEHVQDPAHLLTELGSRLSPRGWLMLQTIHENSLLPALGRLSYRVTGGRFMQLAQRTHEAHHLVFFSRAGIDRLVADAGLSTREIWFSRLARERMDGNPVVTATAAALMAMENAWGNGLFVNCILERV